MSNQIIIRGAREHNLKNISLSIPRNKLVVFTGLSGSGKSSLAFDTIFAEGQRRYVESLSAYARQFLGQMQKPDVDEIEGLSPAIAIDQKAHSANPRSTVATVTEIYDYLRVLFARVGKPHCPICHKPIRKMTPEEMVDRILEKITEKETSDSITILAPVVVGRKGEYHQMLYDFYNDGYAEVRVDGKTKYLRNRILLDRNSKHTIELVIGRVPVGYPIQDNKAMRTHLAETIEIALQKTDGLAGVIFGDKEEILMSAKFSCPEDDFSFPEIEPRLFSFNSPYGACPDCHGLGTEDIFSENPCPVCKGKRLKPEALSVLIGKKNIDEIVSMNIENAYEFFANLDLTEKEIEISKTVLKEISQRIKFMLDVGLGYLTMARKAGTLSGGEAQRIRLASQVGTRLTGALYVLDEPTIGLHQRDNERLLATLQNLKDLGNTVIVVEHDEDTILSSDYLVDIGPGAGQHGGEIVAAGETLKLLQSDPGNSLTLQYLQGKKKIDVPKTRRKDSKEKIEIHGASANNLKNIKIEIPLKRFVCVTGVSGSGKSTIVNDILHKSLSQRFFGTKEKPGAHKKITGTEHIKNIIVVDQSPIGRTPRSNPATYTGAWGHIRELFAMTPEARVRGYKVGRFSFNRAGGRCEHCEGNGTIAIEMHFLPTVFVKCDICKGKRFDRETLEVKFKDKSIADVLDMTIDEADVFFRDIPAIHDKMKILREVGLGYLHLGQGAPTLSGGEAQRIKLGRELAKYQHYRIRSGTNNTLYILDEPTVGLHYEDVKKLIEVLQRLVSMGNSIVVIEHNLDVIKNADHIIDIGPDGGDKGGEIVATGTPEEVARNGKSYTGGYLRRIL
jgi:excinuclease ABC subunit A